MRMFKKVALCAVIVLAFVLNPSAYAVEIPATFTFNGSGYGHGVGMSQIGARGQALEGRNASEILSYYYPGTQLQAINDSQTIRVNIGHLLTKTSISLANGAGEFSVYRGNGELVGTYSRDITATFSLVTDLVIPQLTSPTAKFSPIPGANQFTITWKEPSTLRVGVDTSTVTSLYKYGFLSIKTVSTVAGPRMELVNALNLHDEYLWGIGEVPSSWPAAALEAQAIASRTYALTKIGSIRKECDCHVYNTIADQNFVGFSKESELIYGPMWKAAVNRTSVDSQTGLAVIYNGKVANTYFFSSSAGATQNIKDVWSGTYPYLVSVPDTWSVVSQLNPRYYTWDRVVSQKTMAAAFGLPDVVSYQILARSKTGAVTTIQGISSSGKVVTLSGEAFRSRVKIPSAWFGLIVNQVLVDNFDSCFDLARRTRGKTAAC